MWYKIARRALAAHDDDYDLGALGAQNPEELADVQADELMRAFHAGEEWQSPSGAIKVGPGTMPSFEEWQGTGERMYHDDFQNAVWSAQDFIKRMRDGGPTSIGTVVPMTQQIAVMGELGVVDPQEAARAADQISQIVDLVQEALVPVERGFDAFIEKSNKLSMVWKEDRRWLDETSRDPRVDMGDELEALIARESEMSTGLGRMVHALGDRVAQIVSGVVGKTLHPLYKQNLLELMVKNGLGSQHLQGSAKEAYDRRDQEMDRDAYENERRIRGLS